MNDEERTLGDEASEDGEGGDCKGRGIEDMRGPRLGGVDGDEGDSLILGMRVETGLADVEAECIGMLETKDLEGLDRRIEDEIC